MVCLVKSLTNQEFISSAITGVLYSLTWLRPPTPRHLVPKVVPLPRIRSFSVKLFLVTWVEKDQ